jgi:hypothetical protein
MTSTKRASLVTAGMLLLAIVGAACSSDDSSSDTTTTRASGDQGSAQTINSEYETWCTSVQNLIEQSSPDDLSDLGVLSAFNDAVQSLATTAPEPVLSDMQAIATASEAKLEAAQVDPTATLPPEIAQQADEAQDRVAIWVSENCGGLRLPELDL